MLLFFVTSLMHVFLPENEVIDDGYRTHVQVNGTPAASKGHVQGNGVHAFSNATYTKRTEGK